MKRKVKFILRIMSHQGHYPRDSFTHKDAVFISGYQCNVVYSLVKYNKWDKEHSYSEMLWAYISEIRLWSALHLSVPEEFGSLCVYPNWEAALINSLDFPSDDFSDASFLGNLGCYVYSKVSSTARNIASKYHYQPSKLDYGIQSQLYEAIDPTYPLLMRGLSLLLKSQIVSKNYLLLKEAALLVYVAIEAGLKIIRKRLIEDGTKNPSMKDVLEVIEKKYPFGENLFEYFRECYDNRTIIVHPENTFGTYYTPPLFADDFLDTYTAVCGFYRYLLIAK